MFGYDTKAQGTKEKTGKLNRLKSKKHMCFKGHQQESEKSNYRMGENTCESHTR